VGLEIVKFEHLIENLAVRHGQQGNCRATLSLQGLFGLCMWPRSCRLIKIHDCSDKKGLLKNLNYMISMKNGYG
jgi:hypothetical protein